MTSTDEKMLVKSFKREDVGGEREDVGDKYRGENGGDGYRW